MNGGSAQKTISVAGQIHARLACVGKMSPSKCHCTAIPSSPGEHSRWSRMLEAANSNQQTRHYDITLCPVRLQTNLPNVTTSNATHRISGPEAQPSSSAAEMALSLPQYHTGTTAAGVSWGLQSKKKPTTLSAPTHFSSWRRNSRPTCKAICFH